MKSISIYYKIITIFIITIFISVGLVGWFGLKSTSDAYISSTFELNQQSSEALQIEIEKKLEYVPKDALYSTNFYALKKYFIAKSHGDEKKAQMWKQIFSDALIDFLETRKDYFKVRIIDTNADEIISILYDKALDETIVIPQDKLQNKQGRAYVEKAKLLEKGNFFVSEMNLDIENHKIKIPHLPVIRFSTPIIDDNDKLKGVFVTSVYADSVLDILKKHLEEDKEKHISYYLIDKEGNYLFNPDYRKMWNPQLHNGFNFNKDFFSIQKKFQDKNSDVFKLGSKIYSFHKVYPYIGRRDIYWYIISVADTSVAFAQLNEFKLLFFFLFLFVTLLSIYIIRLYILKITKPLMQVSKQLQALSEGEIKKEKINYNAKDEVGEIVRSTIKVVNAIEMTINQANAVANGDFSKDIRLLSENDSLGHSIKEMTQRLKEITHLATALSHGNYDVKIVLKGSEDKLGLALIDMVKYLKMITEIMESIALGNLKVRYKAKGNEDRLGRATLQMIKYLRNILKHANAISQENFSNSIEIKSTHDELGIALDKMTNILYQSSIKNKEEIYFSEGIGAFSDTINTIDNKEELFYQALLITSKYVNAASGVIYSYDKESKELERRASYAYSSKNIQIEKFTLGEGVIGQVAFEQEELTLTNIQDNAHCIVSGTTMSKPKEIFVYPLIHDDELFGVCEMMSCESFTSIQKDYLKKSAAIFASVLHTTIQNVQIKQLLAKSQSAYEELEQASKYKNEFLANMSHELRTPLNSIILLSKLLSKNQHQNLNEKDIEKTKVINKAGDDLLMLINDILDLSKVESGNMELEYKVVSSVEIFDDLKGLFSALADEKHLHFSLVDDYKDNFISDKVKLLQVLKNLLSNAFKFTKEGGVTLHLYKKQNNLIFKVKDSGIGIPQDKLKTIFEAFKQVDGTISREFGGTGLGLSISKTIIDFMGGKLYVESQIGQGSSFIVKIPLLEEKKSTKEDENKKLLKQQPSIELLESSQERLVVPMLDFKDQNEVKSFSLYEKNILLIDDDSRNIFALTSVLENLDAEVLSAFNAKEAIQLLEEDSVIHLILIDIGMPLQESLNLIKDIKADKKYKEIPLITIISSEDKVKVLEAGIDDFLVKPVESSKLIFMMKTWLVDKKSI